MHTSCMAKPIGWSLDASQCCMLHFFGSQNVGLCHSPHHHAQCNSAEHTPHMWTFKNPWAIVLPACTLQPRSTVHTHVVRLKLNMVAMTMQNVVWYLMYPLTQSCDIEDYQRCVVRNKHDIRTDQH